MSSISTPLLLISFGLMLFAVKAVTVNNPIEIEFLKLSIQPEALLRIGLAICVYLEILVSVRTYTDLNLYRLRTSIAELDARSLSDELGFLIHSETSTKRWKEMRTERRGVGAVVNFPMEAGGHSRQSKRQPLYKEQRRYETRGRDYQARRRIIEMKRSWFRKMFSASYRSRIARFTLEIFFPLIFGAIGIIQPFEQCERALLAQMSGVRLLSCAFRAKEYRIILEDHLHQRQTSGECHHRAESSCNVCLRL